MFIPLPFYSPMDAVPGLEINTLLDYLFKFFLSSVRLSAFLISSPFLGSRNIPLNVKIVFSMVISFFILVIFLIQKLVLMNLKIYL